MAKTAQNKGARAGSGGAKKRRKSVRTVPKGKSGERQAGASSPVEKTPARGGSTKDGGKKAAARRPARKAAASKGPSDAKRAALRREVEGARAGDGGLSWLDTIIREAGYAPVAASDDAVLVRSGALTKALGISRRGLTRMQEAGLPVVERGRGGRPNLYDISAVLRWQRENDRDRREMSDADPLLSEGSGGSSPNLERYRFEKARAEKRKNDVEEKRLIPVEKVRDLLASIAALFRARIDALTRAHGQEVGDTLAEAVDEMDGEVGRRFESNA